MNIIFKQVLLFSNMLFEIYFFLSPSYFAILLQLSVCVCVCVCVCVLFAADILRMFMALISKRDIHSL